MSARPSLATRLASAATPAKAETTPRAVAPVLKVTRKPATPETVASAKARDGKTMIAGYFTQDLARAVKMLAVERGVSVQAIIGEGLDAVLREHNKHPFGER